MAEDQKPRKENHPNRKVGRDDYFDKLFGGTSSKGIFEALKSFNKPEPPTQDDNG